MGVVVILRSENVGWGVGGSVGGSVRPGDGGGVLVGVVVVDGRSFPSLSTSTAESSMNFDFFLGGGSS